MSGIEPVVPNLVNATTTLQNKYAPTSPYASPQQILAALGSLPTPPHLLNLRAATTANTISPLARYDLTRANRGLAPLNARQSAAALQTLATGAPATPPRRQGFLQSAVSDLRALVGAIPKLPMLAVHELQQLPDVPAQLPAALDADNPVQALGNVANLPGFRMVPGAFVAGQFGEEGQGVQGLLAHPLFTALDILPYAQGAAARTGVVKAATAEAEAANAARVQQALDLTGEGGNARLAKPPRPLQTLATRRLNAAGEVVPNRFGGAVGSSVDAFYSTALGRSFEATFKERAVPRLESRHTSLLRRYADLDTPRATLPGSINGVSILPMLDLRDRLITIRDMSTDAGIDATRTAELYEMASDPRLPDGTPVAAEQLPGLTDMERGVLTEIRDWQAERARLTEGTFTGTINVDGTPEVYDLPTARRLSRNQASLTNARELRDARALIDDPSTATPDAIIPKIADVEDRVAAGTLTKSIGADLTRTYRAALDEAGYVWDDAAGTFNKITRPTRDDLLIALRPLARRYPTIPRLIDHLSNARWSAARRDLDSFASTRAGGVMVDTLPFDIDGLKAELTRLQQRDRVLARTSKFTDKRVARLEAQVNKSLTRAVPARFAPAVQAISDEAITGRVKEIYAGSPDLDRVVAMATDRVYGPIRDLPDSEVRALQAEARDTWRALREAGHDPIFFSRVTPQQRARIPYTRVSEAPVTPAAARARMWDATPHVADMGVALSKDAMDLMQRRATEAFLDEFEATYSRTRATLEEELLPRARARAANTPGMSVKAHLARLIDERWQPFNRSQYSSRATSPALSITGRDAPYVPRAMGENMERLFHPPLPKITAAFDPIMRVFRTSVLPLAPRWHIYNAVGGAAMTAIHDPMAFRYLPEVIREMWANRESTGGIGVSRTAHQLQPRGAPPSGFGTMPAEVRAWDAEIRSTSPYRDRLASAHNYAAGRTLRDWWETAREGRLGKIASGAKRGIEKSYNANQMVDDMYRSIVGVSERKRALARGATREMADAAAVHSIRRVFQAWDEMTPMERSIMRSVVPFYGWSSHILKYAFSYPFDHPIRTSILGSFARAELADAATGLPDYIRDMVLIGDTRANGVVKALNVGPFNPFRDLPSNFTVAGFLGNLNPIMTGVLESVGINVQQGGPSLYPETRYDPETGRLVVDPGGNLISNIIGNVSPQTNLFTALIGRNEGFNQLLARDPEAAGRQLMSNLGIPVLFRSVDVGEQLIRAEMARFEDQENARREALKTGNLDALGDFPGLAAYGEQVRALDEAGALDQLRPTPGAPGTQSAIGRAYSQQLRSLELALLGNSA